MAVAAGQKIRASDISAATASGIQSDSGTCASTTFTGTRTGTSNIAGTAFTAPNSGNIMVLWSAGLSIVTGGFSTVSFQIAQGAVVGSGAIVQAASDNIQIQGTSTGETSESSFYPISGLTAGNSYNIQLMYRIGGGATNSTINRPRVAVMPLLA